METSIIVGVACTAFLGWSGWITVFVINTNTKAMRSLANDEVAQKEIQTIVEGFKDMTKELKEGFKEFADDVKDNIKQTNKRLDTFVSNEISELKRISKDK